MADHAEPGARTHQDQDFCSDLIGLVQPAPIPEPQGHARQRSLGAGVEYVIHRADVGPLPKPVLLSLG
jgi:hypothetical protein